ncbi:hypothetical protein B7463_g4781, partial [Scytalidium lignicola]
MAGVSNGKAIDPAKKGSNGHVIVARAKQAPKKGGFSLFSVIFRLFCWYSIVTILFRCPATPDLLTDTSPKICTPYFEVRSIVAPHLEPYYTTYAAPYLDAARPYYDAANKSIITPVTVLGRKYGAPRLAQAQEFGQAQWEKSMQPQVQKYQAVLKENYDRILAPHVNTVVSTASPYYDIAKTSALQTYYEHVLPTYTMIQPYALQGYSVANDFAVHTAIPYTRWAWTNGNLFLSRSVWPRLRILYGENVEPQLVRIGERLGRYRDGKKIEAAANEVDSASSSIPPSSAISSVYSTSVQPIQTSSEISITQSSVAPIQTPVGNTEIRLKAQEIVQRDLKVWQEKFVKAADESADELEDRIAEITERLIKNQAQGVGKAHIIQLEETMKSNLESLKSSIIAIVENFIGTEDRGSAEEKINNAVRKAGTAIKDKAQAIRTWRQNYDKEANYLISSAGQDTLIILDHIGDIGIQEIGMRWAWTDGITHRDWAKYHGLKPKFDKWRDEVVQIAVDHPGIEAATAAGAEIEEKAMSIAEDAVAELARLKEVAKWKLANQDTSDDFSTKIIPSIVAAAQDKMESVESVVSSFVADAASSVSSFVVGESQSTSESIASSASESSISHTSAIDTQTETAETAETISPVQRPSHSSLESDASIVNEVASKISEQPSLPVSGEEHGVLERASSSVESAASLSEPASEVSKDASSSISSAIASSSPVDPAKFTTISPADVASNVDDSAKEVVSTANSEVKDEL